MECYCQVASAYDYFGGNDAGSDHVIRWVAAGSKCWFRTMTQSRDGVSVAKVIDLCEWRQHSRGLWLEVDLY